MTPDPERDQAHLPELDSGQNLGLDPELDLVVELARARSTAEPGPDSPPGPAVRAWAGPVRDIPADPPAGALDLHALLRLSLAATDEGGRLRPNPSAGACHPVDLTLTVGGGCSLPPGRYGYDPLHHQVHELAGEADELGLEGVVLDLGLTPRRTLSHYGHRSWPLMLLDVGHAVGALVLAAETLGAPAPVFDLSGQTEGAVARVRVLPLTDAHPSPSVPSHAAEVLLARRSAIPPLDGPLEHDALHAVLTAAHDAGEGLNWCVARGGSAPGLLELDDLGQLRQLASGDARQTLAVWAARQGWIATAGAVLLGYGCPDDADHQRVLASHLRAGYALQRAAVAATSRALRTRPLGAWQQADLGARIGATPGRDWIVHGLAIGAPGATGEPNSQDPPTRSGP